MEQVNIQDIVNLISQKNPMGIDITHDEDFVLIKNRKNFFEDRSLGLWKEKKDHNVKEKIDVIYICLNILKTKSKNLQVVGFLLEEMIKQDGLLGFDKGLDIISIFCENFIKNCFPIVDEFNFLFEREKIFHWMDEKIFLALKLSNLFNKYSSEKLSFEDVEKINSLGIYSKNKVFNLSNEEKTSYNIVIKKLQKFSGEESPNFIIEKAIEKIEHLNTYLKENHGFNGNQFFKSHMLLHDIQNFLTEFVYKNLILKENSQENYGSKDNIKKTLKSVKIKKKEEITRDDIYFNFDQLSKKLLKLEPHSPVPHFIFKVLSWKDKSFIEIAQEFSQNMSLLKFIEVPKDIEKENYDSKEDNDFYTNGDLDEDEPESSYEEEKFDTEGTLNKKNYYDDEDDNLDL